MRRFAEKLLCLVFFFLVYLHSTNAENNPSYNQNLHRWGAVSNVRAVAQTPDGILWFGTEGGLAKFDGRQVQKIAVENLGAQIIYALATTADGSLWIGTDKGAARLFDNKFFVVSPTVNKPITAILIRDNSVFLSCSDTIYKAQIGGENSLDVSIVLQQPLEISSLATDGENLLLGSRGRGLIRLENDAAEEVMSRPRPYFVNVLKRDEQNNLWLGTESNHETSGLFLANDRFHPQQVGENVGTVTAIASGSDEDLWVGTEKNGVFHLRNSQILENFTFENTAGGLRSNRVFDIFVDRESVVWIGTDRGISRFDAQSPFNQILSDSANSNFIRTLFKSADGRIFAGTNRGLFQFENGGWRESEKFSGKVIFAIAEDENKRILIGSGSGLFTLDGEKIFAGEIRAVQTFEGKTYAAVFGQGIVKIENNLQNLIFSNDSPTSLSAENDKLWIGTGDGGIFVFDGKQVSQIENLSGAAIRQILPNNENVWIAADSGLYLSKNGNLEAILKNQFVRNVTVDGAEIWAATAGNGLFHLKFDETFGWLASNINAEQGLPTASVFALLKLENKLLVGTNRGVAEYVPNKIEPRVLPTRILSQRLYSVAEMVRGINLEYPQNSLLLEVAGLSSRTFPEQFQYGFLLKNANGSIIEKKISGDNQFLMDKLAAGNYTVEAVVFNQDLAASAPLSFNFSVARAPFPWTSTALGVLLTIVLIALVLVIVERRQISKTNRELTAARFDLANEAERERRRIARDLHDQTLADLRNLMLMSDKLPVETADFRVEIENVSNEIRRICEDLSPSVLENVGLTAALEFLLSNSIANHKFVAPENTEVAANLPTNAQMQIFRIAQEVLNNINRHSTAKIVEMRVSESAENDFTLEIEDDGKVFEPQNFKQKGRGLTNIKSRAALIEAEAVWQTSDKGGTVFRLHKKI